MSTANTPVARVVPGHPITRNRVLSLGLAMYFSGVSVAFAQEASPESIAELRNEISALRKEQAERELRLQRLEATLQRIAGPATTASGVVAQQPRAQAHVVAPTSTQKAESVSSPGNGWPSRLKVSGDLRIRGQGDRSDNVSNRGSMQVRGRLGATLSVDEDILIGARIVTGDGDDPNSADIQLSNWVNDLEVSLDQAYIQYSVKNWTLYGGKLPQPFVRTDLVWDGDVNPQGVAAIWRKPLAAGGSLRVNGLAFIVNELSDLPDTTMLGGQVGYFSPKYGDWQFDVHGAYYHYDVGSMSGADSGDWRSNLRTPDGNYLSDFHLVDALAGVSWFGLGERWPVRLVVDHVLNLGARTDADSGHSADLAIGRATASGDWRVTYGYAMAQNDAVLAAFSHDNMSIATNYRLHGLTLDYVPTPNTMLSAYWYRYRPYDLQYSGGGHVGTWSDRLRLAFLVSF